MPLDSGTFFAHALVAQWIEHQLAELRVGGSSPLERAILQMVKPNRLRPGDTVAIVSPSWGGPSVFPYVYELGLRNIQNFLGLKVKEFPTARMSQPELYNNPKLRAEDINAAFADPEVNGIIASIGGSESVRILPFIDYDSIVKTPKVLMGYSDTTTLTSTLNNRGMVTFNGPAVMAGFAQMRYLPTEFPAHVRSILMEPEASYEYNAYRQWANNYLEWKTPGYDGEVAPLQPHEGWQWLQGEGVHSGRLFGGCIEVFEFLKATPWWPDIDFWNGKILCLETSEDKPLPENVEYMLRNYGSMGALERLAGLVIGRARSYTPEEKDKLYKMLPRVVGYEFERPDMPILANFDFGHTDPQFIMPLGINVELDCANEIFPSVRTCGSLALNAKRLGRRNVRNEAPN